MVTDPQTVYFEADIRFGTLYHRLAGTSVSPGSARSLERAMTEATEDRLYCESVSVRILDDALDIELAGSAVDYTELTGRFMEAEMRIDYKGVRVRTEMEMEDGYPLMKIVSVE